VCPNKFIAQIIGELKTQMMIMMNDDDDDDDLQKQILFYFRPELI